MNYKSLFKLSKKELVGGLPKLDKIHNTSCRPYQHGKHVRVNNKQTYNILTNRPLELLYMNLMGPSRIENLGSRHYIIVEVNEYSRSHGLYY